MKQYNVITLDITNGLSVQKFGTKGGYLQLQSAPANANVRVHMDDPSAPGILLKTNYSIHAKNAKEFYVSCDAVPGGTISFVQSTISQDFYIETPASDVNVDQIGSFGASAIIDLESVKNIIGSYDALAIGQLDKIINPYQEPIITHGQSSATAAAVLFSETLAADIAKIEITLNTGRTGAVSTQALMRSVIGTDIVLNLAIGEAQPTTLGTVTIEGVQGKYFEIYGYNSWTSGDVFWTIKKYKLKP